MCKGPRTCPSARDRDVCIDVAEASACQLLGAPTPFFRRILFESRRATSVVPSHPPETAMWFAAAVNSPQRPDKPSNDPRSCPVAFASSGVARCPVIDADFISAKGQVPSVLALMSLAVRLPKILSELKRRLPE